jgi:hypothetical protein
MTLNFCYYTKSFRALKTLILLMNIDNLRFLRESRVPILKYTVEKVNLFLS